MSTLSQQEIDAIARKIVTNLTGSPASNGGNYASQSADSSLGIFNTLDEAVAAAREAFPKYVALPLKTRNRIIRGIRDTAMENASALAKAAHEETGLGRYEDKIVKNQLVAEKTPGPEILRPQAQTGDHGLCLTEPAPFGVIGSITPSTNPTSTIINNTISMISAGNTVVYNVHPGAKNCSMMTVALINKAIVAAGGPKNVVCCITQPTIESAQALMTHPGIRLLVVTGGGAVVKAAMNSGKRAICAGPGNPPVVVDETANIDQAARDTVLGASTDNNVICADEKEVFVVDSVADDYMTAMTHYDAVKIERHQLAQLEQVIFTKTNGPGKRGYINRDYIGKNASVILSKIGLRVPDSVRLGIVEVDFDHPLVWTEQLMPILPIVRAPNADRAIDMALQAEQGCYHTAIMHSKNLDNLHRMAAECNCSIFVKNGRSQAGMGLGGEGCTSFTIASPTGEGMTNALSFSRWRRCVLKDKFRIV